MSFGLSEALASLSSAVLNVVGCGGDVRGFMSPQPPFALSGSSVGVLVTCAYRPPPL